MLQAATTANRARLLQIKKSLSATLENIRSQVKSAPPGVMKPEAGDSLKAFEERLNRFEVGNFQNASVLNETEAAQGNAGGATGGAGAVPKASNPQAASDEQLRDFIRSASKEIALSRGQLADELVEAGKTFPGIIGPQSTNTS